MATMISGFEKAYNSFSGVDIKAMVGEKPLANLQAVSISVTREKAPVYTMGSADPRSFSRGKRGIVGTLVLIVFDRHALLDPVYGLGSLKAWLDNEEYQFGYTDPNGSSLFDVNMANVGLPVEQAENPSTHAGDDQHLAYPIYSDQIPPFDIALSAANEYGKRMRMWIGGVEILNEGMGFSIDDINMETQTTYVARGIVPWHPVENPQLAG